MIRHSSNHWFECLYPTLEPGEEEIFYQHPTEGFKCNQLGVLYYDEARYVVYDLLRASVVRELAVWNGDKMRALGSKFKIVWECYHGEIIEGRSHFTLANNNPLDLTRENLLLTTNVDKKDRLRMAAKKSRFVKASAEYLVGIEPKYEKRGMDNQQLYKSLLLPNWLITARKKYKGPVPKSYARK